MQTVGEVAEKMVMGHDATTSTCPVETAAEVCPHCGGTGWRQGEMLPPGHPDYGKLVPCECESARKQRRARLQQRVERFSMPIAERYTFENFDADWHQDVAYAYRAARRFAQKPSGCLILWSPAKYGNGKSHLLMAAIRELWTQSQEAVAFSVPDFLDWLRGGYKGEADIAELLSVGKDVAVLGLDDLGVENVKPWVREKLFQIIDYRYRNDMALLISMNMHPRHLSYPRLTSRMMDTYWALRVKITAPDYRERKERRRG